MLELGDNKLRVIYQQFIKNFQYQLNFVSFLTGN